MTQEEASRPEQLPDSILFDILVLVQSALPPLRMTSRMLFLDALVSPRSHEGTKSTPGVRFGVAVDDVLHHGVIEQEAVHGAVASLDEVLLEPALVEAADALLATVSRPQELDICIGMVGIHVNDLHGKVSVPFFNSQHSKKGKVPRTSLYRHLSR